MQITWYKQNLRGQWRIKIQIPPSEWEQFKRCVAPHDSPSMDGWAKDLRGIAHQLFQHAKEGLEYCVHFVRREGMTYQVDGHGNLIETSKTAPHRVVAEAVVAPQVLERYCVDGTGRIQAHRARLRQFSNAHPCNPPPPQKKDQV